MNRIVYLGSLIQKEVDRRIHFGIALPDPSLDAPLVLSQCFDFSNEIGALKDIVHARGHILLLSPKCHPELAGCGVEYSWGRSKTVFRREKNDLIAKHLHANILQSLSPEALPISLIWRFERRTRDYRRMYKDLQIKMESGIVCADDVCYKFLETMRKTYKSHRNIEEIDRNFISAAVATEENV